MTPAIHHFVTVTLVQHITRGPTLPRGGCAHSSQTPGTPRLIKGAR